MPEPANDPGMLDAALALASEGFAVFPCHTPRDGKCSCPDPKCERIGKHPRTAHGLKDATRDEATIREWWRKWPDANVAIATGQGLVVLDVDIHKEGSSAPLDLPETRRVVTGSGGEHWYMRVTDGEPVGNSVELVGPGLDIRGDGGYVLAPPSMHECGRRYAWDAGGAATIGPAPEWLLRMARQKRSQPASKDTPDAFVSGARNDAMFKLGAFMRGKGFRVESITAALLSENAARCRPPLDEDEIRRTAKSTGRYEAGEVNPVEWRLLTGAALAAPLPPIPWLCRELGIAPGAVTLIAGSNHSGKTMALQALAVAVASGGKLWGRFAIEPGHVLHVDYEQGERVTRIRYQRMALAFGGWMDIWNNITVADLPAAYLDAQGSLETLERICMGKRLCFIDSLKAAWPSADENKSDVRKWLDALLPISQRTGCVFVVIHHTRKITRDAVGGTKMMIRGSSAIADACENIFSIVETGVKHQCLVHHDKARLTGHRLDPFTLTTVDLSLPVEDIPADIASGTTGDLIANATGSLRFGLEVVAGDVDSSATLEARIVQFLDRHTGQNISKIRKGVVGRDIEIDAAVRRMVRDGIITQRIGVEGHTIYDVAPREPGDDWDPDRWN